MVKGLTKSLLLGSAVLALSGPAFAGSPDVEERIAALEAMVADLKAELAKEKADMDDATIRIEKVEKMAADRPTATTNGFKVGDTTLKISGFVDLDTHVTSMSDGGLASSSVGRDFYIPSLTQVGGEETTTTDMTAQASRFAFTAQKPVGDKKVTGYLEYDFLVTPGGNERVSNSWVPRMRRAYVDYDGWRIGQEWTTFQDLSAIPESASFLVLSDGMVFNRQPMIRYTNGNWQFALENGNATITNPVGGRIEADSNLVPDVIARYNAKGDFGSVSFSAIGRQLRLDTGATEEDTFGFGAAIQGRLKMGEKDDVRFTLVGGEGLGRYVGLNATNAAAMDPTDGSLEAIPSFGGLVAWRHPFGETARFNIGYSGLWVDNPDFLPGGVVKSVQSGYAAVLWDIAPKVTLGTEFLHGIRENENGADGSISRFTFSTKYAF